MLKRVIEKTPEVFLNRITYLNEKNYRCKLPNKRPTLIFFDGWLEWYEMSNYSFLQKTIKPSGEVQNLNVIFTETH